MPRIACLLLCLLLPFAAAAATFWTGPTVTFTKAGSVDPSLAANQDRLTDTVWITRGNAGGLYNAQVEAGYDFADFSSPAGTEWAFGGTIADGVETLSFLPWADAVGRQPPGYVGIDGVLHLIAEDIYIDVRFTQWDISCCGGFVYERSSPPASPTAVRQVPLLPWPGAMLLVLGVLLAARQAGTGQHRRCSSAGATSAPPPADGRTQGWCGSRS